MLTRALGRAVGWNEIVSGMLRMHLLTDYMRKLNDDGLINESAYLKVHKFGNEALNGGEKPPSPEPFALVDQMLINEFGLPQAELKSAFQIAVANSSALSYIQLGRPETIAIATPEASATFERIYEAIHAPEDVSATKPVAEG
jgi:pantoate kinase